MYPCIRTKITYFLQIMSVLCFCTAVAAEPKILHKGNGSEPQSLDPHKSSGAPESTITMDQLEGLLTTASTGENVPGVAQRWEISPDGKTYTFFLRENAKWSNGDPVTAADFIYAWQRMVDPKTASVWTYIIQPVQNATEISNGTITDLTKLGVRAEGDYKLIVTLNAPTPYFLSLAAHSCMSPLHKKTVETNGVKWTKPGTFVGNGAFTLEEWLPQSHVKLTKNIHYWDSDAVKLDAVMFYPIDDRQAELKRFKTGDLHMTRAVPTDQIAKIKSEMPELYKAEPLYATYFYAFNHTRAPYDNLKVRQALSLAIDREKLVKQVTKGDEKEAYSLVPPAGKEYVPQEMMCTLKEGAVPVACKSLTQEQRERLAKNLFAEANVQDMKPLQVVFNTDDNHKKIAIAISGMWKSVLGLDTELTNREWKVYLASKEKRDYDVFRQVWRADYRDPSTFLVMFKSDSQSDNTAGYFSKVFDKTMFKSAHVSDPQERMNHLMAAEKQFMADYTVAPLYYFVENVLVAKNVTGHAGSAMGYHLSKWIDIQN